MHEGSALFESRDELGKAHRCFRSVRGQEIDYRNQSGQHISNVDVVDTTIKAGITWHFVDFTVVAR